MARVYICDRITDTSIEGAVLGEDVSCTFDSNAEVLLVWHLPVTEDLLNKHPNLKAVIRYGVGYDNVDLAAAERRGIVVCNTPDYGVDEVADSAVAMILSFSRDIFRLNTIAKTDSSSWDDTKAAAVSRSVHTTVGVIGAGRIGGSVLTRLKSLRFDTVFYDPYKDSGYEKLLNSRRVDSIDELLLQSDIISINTPLTDETRNMANKDFISKIKRGASFVNTARGKIVEDIDDFYLPMKNGDILYLGLDVLPFEPPKPSKLLDAWRNNESWIDGRVIITPHHAFYSVDAYKECRRKAAENALRVLQGVTPKNILSNGVKHK